MKRNKTRLKNKITRVNTLSDLVSLATEFNIPMPDEEVSLEVLKKQYPHLMLLLALHKGKIKSYTQIKNTAKALLTFSDEELFVVTPDDLRTKGIRL